MNNINQVIEKTTGQKTFWSKLVYPVALFSLLNLANIHDIHAQSNEPSNSVNTELSVGEFISKLNKNLGVTLPAEYDSKVRNFVQNNYVMQNNNARVFTQNFIIDEMKKNWGISKQNQLLFIRYSIYYNIEKKDLYDGTDGDENRLEEFEIALDFIENSGNQYINNLKIYINESTENMNKKAEDMNKKAEDMNKKAEDMNKKAEDMNKKAEDMNKKAEDVNKKAEDMNKKAEDLNKKVEDLNKKAEELKNETIGNINKIMSADSAGLRNLVDIYDLYKKDPSSMTAGEIQKAKELARYFISDCKKYGIDYKKLLSPEVCRFYGIE